MTRVYLVDDHPNVVRVLDFGQEPDGLLYITMELLAGSDLRNVLTDYTFTSWSRKDGLVGPVRQCVQRVLEMRQRATLARAARPADQDTVTQGARGCRGRFTVATALHCRSHLVLLCCSMTAPSFTENIRRRYGLAR